MRGRKIGVCIILPFTRHLWGGGGFPSSVPLRKPLQYILNITWSVWGGVDKAKLKEFYQKPIVLVDREYAKSRSEEIYRLLAYYLVGVCFARQFNAATICIYF